LSRRSNSGIPQHPAFKGRIYWQTLPSGLLLKQIEAASAHVGQHGVDREAGCLFRRPEEGPGPDRSRCADRSGAVRYDLSVVSRAPMVPHRLPHSIWATVRDTPKTHQVPTVVLPAKNLRVCMAAEG
jgi:hypothetical protein